MDSAQTVKIRVLILSDTHSATLAAQNSARAFRTPLPSADIVIHCGDLTNTGQLREYERTLSVLGSINAELKLVIAGNHDLTLDGKWWSEARMDEDGQSGDHGKAVEFWKGSAAKSAGVTYLDEGVYEFALKSGATISVYASPYQPEFCGWAFPYRRNEDRYNPAHLVPPSKEPIATNPIPSFPNVDIMITHGPPAGHLDATWRGTHVGCENLRRALGRVRPRLHCFGHIHEGWGAEAVEWEQAEGVLSGKDDFLPEQSVHKITEPALLGKQCAYVDVSSASARPHVSGQHSLLVNAAIMDVRYHPVNRPWVVDLDLPLMQD